MRPTWLLAPLLLAPLGLAQDMGPAPRLLTRGYGPGPEAPAAVDVDGDGLADLLTAIGDREGHVYVARNEHGWRFPTTLWCSGLAASRAPWAAADLDGDGRADVAALDRAGRLVVGRSTGTALVTEPWEVGPAGADPAAVASRDQAARAVSAAVGAGARLVLLRDGDGFPDLLLLPAGDAPGAVLRLANAGRRRVDAPAPWGDAPGDALAADLDGDGASELAWWRAGTLHVARGGAPEAWGTDLPGPLLAAGDADGDGDDDLAADGAWLLSHGAGVTVVRDGRLAGRARASVACGDLDGDGGADLVWFERTGEGLVLGLLSRPPTWGPAEAWAPLGLDPARPPALLDLGPAGLVVGDQALVGDGRLGVRLLPGPPAIATSPAELQAADLDGDGRTDLVRRPPRGGLEWARGLPGAAFAPYVEVASPADAPADRAAEGAAWTVAPAVSGSLVVLGDRLLAWRDGALWARPDAAPVASATGRWAGDVDGDGAADVVALVGSSIVVSARTGPHDPAPAVAWALEPAAARPRALVDLTGDGRADLLAEGPEGALVLVADPRARAFRRLGPATRLPGPLLGLATGLADGPALLAVGPAGDLLVSRLGGTLDRDADGLSDRDELRLHGSDPARADTDRDGLPDGAEVAGLVPGRGGLRLDRLGCSPARRDVLLELCVEQGADEARVERARARVAALFGRAPLANPDGSQGIAAHVARGPVRPAPGLGLDRHGLREAFFTPRLVGLSHWMHLAAGGGGGQADLLSDQGSCAGVFEATLPHEFGHQLGLNHGGGTGRNGVPHYPSLMNYAYNYQLGGDGAAIDYSRGALAGLALDERSLPELLDVPAGALRHLAGPPFFFRLEEVAPACTWVDWDRDGVRDEAPVRANIDAASGEGYGPRHILDEVAPPKADAKGAWTTSTGADPVLVDVQGALALLWLTTADARGPANRVAIRSLAAGDDDPARFGRPRVLIDSAGADLSDLTACAAGGELHVALVHEGRVVLFRGPLEGAMSGVGVVASSAGCRPSLCTRGADEVHLALLRPDGGVTVDGDLLPGVTSSVPVGFAHDSVADELLVVTAEAGSRRLKLHRVDPATRAVRSSVWVGGPRASDATDRRPAVVFDAGPWVQAGGRVDIFHAGILDAPHPNTHMYRSYTIGDRAWRGREGWKEDQTWNEWSYSTAGPGAALHGGRPWHASRFWTPYSDRWTDRVAIGPLADGVEPGALRDHDDWALVDRLLDRARLTVHAPRGRVAVGK